MNTHDLSSDTIRLECLKLAQEYALLLPYHRRTIEQILKDANCYAQFVRNGYSSVDHKEGGDGLIR